MTIPLAMIAAVAENGVIGVAGGLPWHIPSDMAFFKRTTMGKPIIMGRKQFETVGRPLPGRTNLVVTRQRNYQPDGVIVINDLDAAVEHARSIAAAEHAREVMIIGGGEIYRQAIGRADRLYITHIALSPQGDVFFPAVLLDQWRVIDMPLVAPSPKDAAPFQIKIYERS